MGDGNLKILITGSDGFIAKNLIIELKNRGYTDLFLCNRNTLQQELEKYLKESDVIIHLAGVNRPNKIEEFDEVNVGLTEDIVSVLKKNQRGQKLLFSSSIMAIKDNPYGISKRKAENILQELARETNIRVHIFRLPNVFGKWCKPNYNSVVATFCYNIANNLEIHIHDAMAKLCLVYIDDVIEKIITSFEENGGEIFQEINPSYHITVGNLSNILKEFKEQRRNNKIPDISDEFKKKLYSTYLSYLDSKDFSYPLKMNVDMRGSFTEFLHIGDGQVSINISKPGVVKGNHWHHTKVEKFLVVKGTAKIQFRHMMTNEFVEYEVSGEKLEVVDIPIGYTHNIINIGSEDLVTVIWANESFHKEKPDTYFEVV